MRLATRLKMTRHRANTRRRMAAYALLTRMVGGKVLFHPGVLESGPSAQGGHSLDAAYRLGPGGRAAELRRQLAQALHERDHARTLACALEQELARQRIGVLPTDQPSTGSADQS
jgi:hypothetical protein